MCVQSQIDRERMSAVMLLVYGDESLDGTQSRVCAVAGLIGTEDAWIEVERAWKERNGPIPFHANHCENDQGDYAPKLGEDADKKHEENKALYRDLSVLLSESKLGGFASALDLAARRKAFPSPYEPPLYYQPFTDVVAAMRNAAADRGEVAELTFDNRLESEFNAGQIYSYLRAMGVYWEEPLASKISFESSRSNARLQMADLFAYEAMKDLDNQIGPVKRGTRKSWECLQGTGRFHIERFGEEYFSDPRMNPDALHKALGFTDSDYAEWLESRRVPPCDTSFLQFLFERRSRMTEEQLIHFNEVYGPHARHR